MAKLDVKALGLAFGIIWAAWVLILGLSAPVCPWAMRFVDVLSPFYVGYSGGFIGSITGGVWAFLDGGIFGVLLAWLYNKLAKG